MSTGGGGCRGARNEATRGQREMHAQYEGNPENRESMHDAGPTGQSHLKEAKAASEERGEHIFAKRTTWASR